MFDWVIYAIIVVAICVTGMVMMLASLVRETCNRLTKTNEQLMILISTRSGNEAGARALVASARLPRGNLSGVVKQESKKEVEKEKEKLGVSFTKGYGL
ncbi:MAG: hypothetical protein PVI43_00575 [Candidatus Bathyarchaeota archaeon]|jgi:hypothetical protein